MTRVGRAWFECSQHGCTADVLRTKAEDAGWYVGDGHLQLCPTHRRDRRALDAAERAAGEDRDS